MYNPGDPIKILTTLHGYVDYSDAEKYLLHGEHTHDYDYTVIPPGDYVFFGQSAGEPDLINISRTAGKKGW